MTGTRPGEKLYEELFYDPASAETTSQPKILRATFSDRNDDEMERALRELSVALDNQDEAEVRRYLFGFIDRLRTSHPARSCLTLP